MVSIHDIYRFSQKENRLTALLTLTMEKQRVVLEKFLTYLELPVTSVDSISISLQGREEDSVPDATFYINGQKYLFIESKIGTLIEADQILSHIRSGKKEIFLVCITSGAIMPKGIEEALNELPNSEKKLLKWISWRQLYQFVESIPEEIQQSMEVSAFKETLEYENLIGFTGFLKEELDNISDFVTRYDTILAKITRLMEDIQLSLSAKEKSIELFKFVRDGRSYSPDVLSFCDYAFSFNNWENCGYDATRGWVREEGSFSAISFYFDEESFMVCARASIAPDRGALSVCRPGSSPMIFSLRS